MPGIGNNEAAPGRTTQAGYVLIRQHGFVAGCGSRLAPSPRQSHAIAGISPGVSHHALAGVAARDVENSPSNVPATDQPLIHFISAEPVNSAASAACRAPLTTSWP